MPAKWFFLTVSLLCLTGIIHDTCAADSSTVTTQAVFLDRFYRGNVSSRSSRIFTFGYHIDQVDKKAIRLQVMSNTASAVSPLIVVVREAKRVTSWEVPLYLEKAYMYYFVRRTLCPAKDFLDYSIHAIGNGSVPENQQVTIELTTQSKEPVDYEFNIWFVRGFQLQTGKPIDFRVAPSAPAFFQYIMPEGVDRVMVRAWVEPTQHEIICSYFSVQPAYCPIADLPREVTGQGQYQTFISRAGFIVKREDVLNGKFDVAIVPLSEDHKCMKQQGWIPQLQKDNIDIAIGIERNLTGDWDERALSTKRSKHVHLLVENVLTDADFWIAVSSVAAFYLMFYVIFRIALCYGFLTKRSVNVPERDSPGVEMKASEMTEGDRPGTVQPEVIKDIYVDKLPKTDATAKDSPEHKREVIWQVDAADGDFLPTLNSNFGVQKEDGDVEANMLEEGIVSSKSPFNKAVITVTEISMRPMRKIIARDRAYNWTLLIIAVFYSLPVVQLLLTYQRVMESTGNMDMCYYNFECSHSLGRVNDFNHVYSNIGYVALGALFCLIVWKRHTIHFRHEQELLDEDPDHAVGLPPQYGLYYALGISLVMEGIMSACYHMCPSYSNFQFDTSFMYLIGGLFMLKIYQSRHADISPNAEIAYVVFAFWIFISVLGVVIDKPWFWITFCVFLIVLSVPFGIQIYYMGSWKFDLGMFRRTMKVFCHQSDGRRDYRCMKPASLDRFGLLMMIFAINWFMAIAGAIFAPTDFSTFLLAIVLANAFFYFMFYMVMKMRSGETIPRMSQFFMVITTLNWTGAMYFFFARLTNWVDTPSISRQGNRACFFLQFYDQHDVWHMLSATSNFFNFLILFTLDDDLFCVPRREIRVF